MIMVMMFVDDACLHWIALRLSRFCVYFQVNIPQPHVKSVLTGQNMFGKKKRAPLPKGQGAAAAKQVNQMSSQLLLESQRFYLISTSRYPGSYI